ncbi:unnamed protein product [Polarella glacialis]|uniref:Helicase C-terminal domain-containing protein n=1 Tax=Polarella glacialis TaxID=89957 RepID=A0A813E0P8_POLGL|nr:unnamed protein product [Polarella glacialis]
MEGWQSPGAEKHGTPQLQTGPLAAAGVADLQTRSTSHDSGDFMQRVRALSREALTWPHLPAWQRLEWAAALMLDVVPMKELPPWFLEKHNVSRRDIGVDLLSLDGQRAVQCKCYNGTIPSRQIQHFFRVARWIFKAGNCILVTSNTSKLTQTSSQELACQQADLQVVTGQDLERLASVVAVDASDVWDSSSGSDVLPPLWPCQFECLKACQQGVRVIEMGCSTGKTRVMYELSLKASGKVLVLVPSHVLLGQFSNVFPHFCQVGMGHNDNIDWGASGFIAVYNSAHLLANVSFSDIYVDEAHHPLPQGCPQADGMYRFSATHRLQPDFKYTMAQAIEDGVVCDYDIVIPLVTEGREFEGLAQMILKQAGHFRRVLAYCNSVVEAQRFKQIAQELGLAAWHINGNTPARARNKVISEFAGKLCKPAHVLVTVQVLGEGVDIPNADTCLFVEPRRSYASIVQAMGRVLRQHFSKPLAHVIMPSVTSDYYYSPCSGTPTGLPPSLKSSELRNKTLAEPVDRKPHKPKQRSELERFLLVLRRADQRLTRTMKEGRNGRIRFIDARVDVSTACSPTRLINRIREHIASMEHDVSDWEDRLNVFVAFVEGYHRLPGERSLHTHERSLAHWIKNLGTRCRRGLLSQQQLHKLSGSHPIVSQILTKWTHPAGLFFQRCHDLTSFVQLNGRLPSRSLADRQEKSLASWVLKIQQKLATLPIQQIQALRDPHVLVAEKVNAWLMGPGKIWEAKCNELGAFAIMHDRLPSTSSQSEEERLLRTWWTKQRETHASLSQDQIDKLSRAHPILAERMQLWRGTLFNWQESFQKVSRFVNCNARIPSKRSSDALERSLAYWITSHRRTILTLSNKQLADLKDAHPLLESRVNSWLQKACGMPAFTGKCSDLNVFLACHDKLPKHSSKIGAERRLAAWLALQAKSIQRLLPEQIATLQSVHPKVASLLFEFTNREVAFRRKCEELRRFVNQTGRCPRSNSEDSCEMILGGWLFRQSRQRHKMSETDLQLLRNTHVLVADRVHQWEDPLFTWRKHCQDMSAFIQTHGRMPKATGTEHLEPFLSTWLTTQGVEYRRGHFTAEKLQALQALHEWIARKVEKWRQMSSAAAQTLDDFQGG